uniref:Immunoglobulin V-set domain-containing protein n=1 Tax=Malurus cyaneus samueli TaxID=2593467 RepID=A0A8C5U7N4_9PASS
APMRTPSDSLALAFTGSYPLMLLATLPALGSPRQCHSSVGGHINDHFAQGGSNHWHQQRSGVDLSLVIDPRHPSRFARIQVGSRARLTITGVQAEDEAVYFCAGQDSSSGMTQAMGSETKTSALSYPLGPGLWTSFHLRKIMKSPSIVVMARVTNACCHAGRFAFHCPIWTRGP